jgi:hypothetical protein
MRCALQGFGGQSIRTSKTRYDECEQQNARERGALAHSFSAHYPSLEAICSCIAFYHKYHHSNHPLYVEQLHTHGVIHR